MLIRVFPVILAAGMLLSASAYSDTVYKSVDHNGKVTYSSSPTEVHQESVKVRILPPPSAEAEAAAQRRHQQNLRAGKTFDETRQKRGQQIAEENRIKREKKALLDSKQKTGKAKKEGPYYGIPGHGIIVLPTGPGIGN